MPCPSTSPKMFCAGPNFWGSDQKLNFIQSCCKRFCASTKTINFLNANHLLLWQLISNLAENIWTSPNYFYTMTLPAGETYLSIKYNVHHLWPNLQKCKNVFGKKILNVTTVKLLLENKIQCFWGFIDAVLFQTLFKSQHSSISQFFTYYCLKMASKIGNI